MKKFEIQDISKLGNWEIGDVFQGRKYMGKSKRDKGGYLFWNEKSQSVSTLYLDEDADRVIQENRERDQKYKRHATLNKIYFIAGIISVMLYLLIIEIIN